MIELNKIYNEDCLTFLKQVPDEFANCCVTSPPYYGLRDYGVEGQIGLEQTPELYVQKLVEIFREVKRVLKKDGTLWLNLGDSYASGKGTCYNPGGNTSSFNVHLKEANVHPLNRGNKSTLTLSGLKPKDLIGIPWMVAFALRADGWWLRQDIIWHKPNPMPESVTDRCTKAHEYIFLLSKSQKYYYDQDAIKERSLVNLSNQKTPDGWDTAKGSHGSYHRNGREKGFKGYEHRGTGDKKLTGHSGNYDANGNIIGLGYANKRSVWAVNTQPFPEAHFATFPEDLIIPCIKAGSPENGIVLDPFNGAGTTCLVSIKLNRNYLACELNTEYCGIAEKRILPYKLQTKLQF